MSEASLPRTVAQDCYPNLNPLIPTSSLLRSLHGVAVAFKAPSELYETICEYIARQDHSTSSQNNGDENSPKENCLSAQEWHNAFSEANFPEVGNDAMILFRVAVAITNLRDASRQSKDLSPQDIEEIWSLIYGAMMNDCASKLTFTVSRSAQGFLAVPLCSILKDGKIDELFRFHVWLPDSERGMKRVSVHSHQAFAQSWILVGQGIDCVFNVDDTEDVSVATHAKYRLQWIGSDAKTKTTYVTHQVSSTISNTGNLVTVSPRSQELHTRNSTYTVPHGVYHWSQVDPAAFHATLFVFDSQQGFIEDAAVIGPMEGTEYTQLRDSGGMTASLLAKLVDDARTQERRDSQLCNKARLRL